MTEKNYARIRQWFLQKEYRYTALKFLYKFLPFIVFITYGAMIIYLCVRFDVRIVKFVSIPALLFVAVSIFRKIMNRPRPYTVLNIEPLIVREKTGESFPSRHVLSVSIIAVACMYINVYAGVAMCVLTVLIAVIRVVSGVHFIRDVVCGALISFIIGGIMFFVI